MQPTGANMGVITSLNLVNVNSVLFAAPESQQDNSLRINDKLLLENADLKS